MGDHRKLVFPQVKPLILLPGLAGCRTAHSVRSKRQNINHYVQILAGKKVKRFHIKCTKLYRTKKCGHPNRNMKRLRRDERKPEHVLS